MLLYKKLLLMTFGTALVYRSRIVFFYGFRQFTTKQNHSATATQCYQQYKYRKNLRIKKNSLMLKISEVGSQAYRINYAV